MMLSILTELLSHISFLQSQYAVLGREGLDVVVRGGERVVGAEVEETWSPPCGPWTGPTMVLTSL